MLRAANLGDSGFRIFRDRETVFRTEAKQTNFNCPLQMGKFSGFGAAQADEYMFPLVKNDIVVIGTDGLFDNLFDHELINIISTTEKNSILRLLKEFFSVVEIIYLIMSSSTLFPPPKRILLVVSK